MAQVSIGTGVSVTNATISQSPAAYYVDSVNGSDSNSGLTGFPVQTIARLVALDASAPINRWLLANGSVFHEQITPPRNNMTIGVYGAGPKPLLDASDPISSGAWTKTAGKTVTYQAVLSDPETAPSSPDWYTSVWDNGVRLAIQHSIAAVDANAGTYYPVPLVLGSTITLYIHASDGSNPGSNGKLYEYAARAYGLNAGGTTGGTVRGIWARRSISANGSMWIGENYSVYDVRVSEGTKHNMLLSKNTYVDTLLADEAYFEGVGSAMIQGYSIADATAGYTLKNVTVQCAAYSGTFGCGDTGNVGAIGNHTSAFNTWMGYFTCINCSTVNTQSGYGMTDVLVGTLTNSSSSQCRYCIQTNNAPGSLTVSGGTFTLVNSSAAAFFNTVGDTTTARSASFDGVTVTIPGLYTAITDGAAPVALRLTNSTIQAVGSNVRIQAAIGASNAASTVYAHNNIITPNGPGATGGYVWQITDAGITLDVDNNSFGPVLSANAAFHRGATDYYLTTWQTAGFDTNSTLVDLQALYDFGSYGAGTTPNPISNSLNPGTWDLTPTALTMTGVSASFNGTTSKGTSNAGIGNTMGYAMVFKATNFTGGSNIMSGQTFTADWRFGAGVQVLKYNGTATSTSSPSALSTGTWYFVAAALGSDGGHTYLGNAGTVSQVGSNATATANSWITSMTIGQRGDAFGPYTGEIAQVKLMNHEPTLSELQTLYNSWVTLNAGRGVTVH